MNTLIEIKESTANSATVQTMSSHEIAELCGKRHDHVMRDIKKMLEELNAPKFGAVSLMGNYFDKKGESRPCYHLPKRECLILVSGYSTTLRAKIIDRWQKLEKQGGNSQLDLANALQNPLTIRQLLLSIDNIAGIRLYANQVLKKHLKIPSGLVTEIISFPHILKTLTHCMRIAYNDFVGCSYAIQYPLWGKHNDGLGTVFLNTRRSF
ncbi:Rha family transcriptional regulator [Bartonella capreoli]|uniref:Rha family transcriptional regulator n=1 Tax=Bartonella capreoli TaxID=155192 RepID=UPI001FE32B2D|nr:Rha family transcriptional regulator [Bartonella capreoli]